ncbi:hypothetical protein [Sulfobacillus harzensis]|uniref:Uncharacterized protein n=1 Tax=Sulfobacillus harzensis TaxID=2729629 RepID=A0A7Y0L5F7_9FIRM|nr:hypothetical protein [Sulfobacillus harzensis]NMP22224.1 hypothetical protein [Sulfobacillus harzensis]
MFDPEGWDGRLLVVAAIRDWRDVRVYPADAPDLAVPIDTVEARFGDGFLPVFKSEATARHYYPGATVRRVKMSPIQAVIAGGHRPR